MRRISSIGVLVFMALMFGSANAQEPVKAGGLVIYDNGDEIKFETTRQGDNIWSVHQRFGLPGDLDINWEWTILPTWRAANPDLAAQSDWIFQPDAKYVVPTPYVTHFRTATILLMRHGITTSSGELTDPDPHIGQAAPSGMHIVVIVDGKRVPMTLMAGSEVSDALKQAGITDIRYREVSVGGMITPMNYSLSDGETVLVETRMQQASLQGSSLLSWLFGALALVLGALFARHVHKAREEAAEAKSSVDAENDSLNKELQDIYVTLAEERDLNQPAGQVGPPIRVGGIDPCSPEAPAVIDAEFGHVADRLREEIHTNGPVTLPKLSYDPEACVLEPTGGEILVAGVGARTGPAYRGYVEGELNVLGGDGRWRKARGHGDPAYFAFFKVTTSSGEVSMPLLYLEACGNDIRFRRACYDLFEGRIVNCTLVEGTGTTAVADDAPGPLDEPDAEAERDETDLKTRAYQLATTPFDDQRTRYEAFFNFVFCVPDGQAKRAELLMRYCMLPARLETSITAKSTISDLDQELAVVRIEHLTGEGRIPVLIRHESADEVATEIVNVVNSLAELGATVQLVLFGSYLGGLLRPTVNVNTGRCRVVSDNAVRDAIDQNPDLFAEGLRVALTRSSDQLNAWLVNTIRSLNATDGQALVKFVVACHDPNRAIAERLAAAAEAGRPKDTLGERLSRIETAVEQIAGSLGEPPSKIGLDDPENDAPQTTGIEFGLDDAPIMYCTCAEPYVVGEQGTEALRCTKCNLPPLPGFDGEVHDVNTNTPSA